MINNPQVNESRFFVGSINKPGPWFNATGEGITEFSLNEKIGEIRNMATYANIENAIWLTEGRDGILVASERYLDYGEVSFFSFTNDGSLAQVGSTQSSQGGAICHIAITPDKRTIFVSSFLGGLTVHGVADNGEVEPAHQVITYQGSGPKSSQEKSHPHQAVVSPDGKFLFVCDLGADKIWIHAIESTNHSLMLAPAIGVAVPCGSGPRHLIFHPTLPKLYVLGQLDGRVYVYNYEGTNLHLKADYLSLPSYFQGEPLGAAIKLHPSRETLYVSNRNSDTITTFRLSNDGNLEKVACFSSLGKAPRDFSISPSGRWLIALNHDSDSIVVFELNPNTGLPTGFYSKPIVCGCPVCVIFL